MSEPSAVHSYASKPSEQTPLSKQVSDIGEYIDKTIEASPQSCPIVSRDSVVHIREMFNEMRALLPAFVEGPAAASHSELTLDQQGTSVEQPLSRIRTRALEAESRRACSHARTARASTGLFSEVAANLVGANELLENILRFAEHGTLVKCREVSKHFHALIDTSPTLQRCLFLRADFSILPDPKPRMLCEFPSGMSDATARDETDDNENFVGRYLSISVWIESPFLRFEHRHGSIWPEMLICQPPVKKLRLPPSMCSPGNSKAYIMCDTGITLGHLYQVVVERLQFHQQYCGPSCRMGMKKIARHLKMSFAARTSIMYGQQEVDFCTAPKPISFPDDCEGNSETMD